MTRHVLDRPRAARDSVVGKSLHIAASGKPRRATLALQRRARERLMTARLAQFLRNARLKAQP